MKFLKILVNSLLSGLFFSLLLALLIMDLNIFQSFEPSFFAQLTLYLFMTYGIAATLVCMLAFIIIQFFSGKKIQIAPFSPVFLLISFTLILIFFLVLFHENRIHLESFFSPEVSRLMHNQYLALLFLCGAGILLFSGYFLYRKSPVWFLLYTAFFIFCIPYAVYQRNSFPAPSPARKAAQLKFGPIEKRFTVIGMEGLSYDFITPLVNQEKLPNFSWLMEQGGWGTLESFTPNELLILNGSLHTGKWPYKHGQISSEKLALFPFHINLSVAPRFLLFYQLDRIGLMDTYSFDPELKTKDIWKIFSSNQTPFVKNEQTSPNPPGEIQERWEVLFNRYYRDLRDDTSYLSRIIKRAFYSDARILDQMSAEREEVQPRLVFFNLNGLNLVEKYFYKYSFPELFGEVDQEAINKYSSVIERYYQFYDEILGRYLASKKDNEMLVLYSSHGIEPLPVWRRGIEFLLGDPQISAFHEKAPDGAVFFYGKEIVQGRNIERMKIVDMAPTLLHYLGLPLGKDMDGIVNSSIFLSSFKMENPVIYITSYEEMEIVPASTESEKDSSLLPVPLHHPE